MKNKETLLEVEGVSKQYTLGMIGRKTLHDDLASWYARKKGKDDPNRKIGTEHIRYGDKFWALKDVSFSVQEGDAVALLGRNGAGKSTMLKLISRITFRRDRYQMLWHIQTQAQNDQVLYLPHFQEATNTR